MQAGTPVTAQAGDEHIIHIKRKRKDPPVDSLYLEQEIQQVDGHLLSQPVGAPARARKVRRTQFMYQRVAHGGVALFEAPSIAAPETSERLEPAIPAPVIPGVTENPDPGTVAGINVNSTTKKRPGRRIVVVSAPGAGPNGERTFVLDKDVLDEVKDAEMADAGPGDVPQIPQKEMEIVPKKDKDQATDDYVWDVMVRTTVNPAPNLQSALVVAPSVFGPNSGRLLLDLNDSDDRELINELYESDEDDEDRVETDDEDENAEGYYGADYPDEEDDEDEEEEEEDEGDEYGGDAYYDSDDEASGGGDAGYYNEATGRFSKTSYLDDL